MQANLEDKIYEERFLLFALVAVALGNIVSNYLGKDVAVLTGSYLFITVSGCLVVLSFMMCNKFGITGQHGIAWIMFACFSVSWGIAETTWIIYDLYLGMDPFPSVADFFYVAGYPFLFVFMLFYLKPVKKGISRKMLVTAISLSSIILASSLFVVGLDIESDPLYAANGKSFDVWGFALALSYPILDAIVLTPAIIGLLLFFKGQVNFLWSLMCLAIASVSIADTVFVLGHVGEFYHTGHYIDIFFLWPYVFMSFGLYHHYSLFWDSK